VHPFDDSDVTWEKLDEWYTANLVNGLGNLVARVMKMAEMHLPPKEFGEALVPKFVDNAPASVLQTFLDTEIWRRIGECDQYIADTEPFKVIKADIESGQKMISYMRDELFAIASYLRPYMPSTAEAILEAIRENKKPENLFKRLDA
jgi:methionyl-tRNA synthetase